MERRLIQLPVARRRYGTTRIQRQASEILSTENVRSDDTATVSGYVKRNRRRCDALQVAAEGISLTCSDACPDMITLDCSESVRAIMPCGHVIGPQSLFDYCMDLLKRGFSEFTCAECNAVWDYATVRHVACLAPDERRTFESRLSENCLNKMIGMQMCAGGCDNWVYRDDTTTTDMVKCLTCSQSKGYTYYFCWSCLHEWKDGTGGKCGNADCSTSDRVQSDQEHLDKCPEHEIGGVMSPSVRACPKCSVLIEHVAKCSHMTCCNCRYEFCFVCLKRYAGFGAASSRDACASAGASSCVGPAPRQNMRRQEPVAVGLEPDRPVAARRRVPHRHEKHAARLRTVPQLAAAAGQRPAEIVQPDVDDGGLLDFVPVRDDSVPAERSSFRSSGLFQSLRVQPVAAARHRPLRRIQQPSTSSDEQERE